MSKKKNDIKVFEPVESVVSAVKSNHDKWFYLMIVIFSALLYANTLTNKYAQDDSIVITDNMFTKQGIKGIPGLLTHDTFYGFFKKEGKDKLVSGGRYRPLSPISFAIEYQFFGLNPFFSHLINILFYIILCLSIFYMLKLLLSKNDNSNVGSTMAFFMILFFLFHPVHTEVVANIKGRDELFSMLFSVLAIIFSVKWIKNKKNLNILFSFIAFTLALFSKENSITIIAIVPIIAFLFFGKNDFSYFKLMIPYLVATVVFMIVRTSILGFDFGDDSMELMNNPFLKYSGDNLIRFTFIEKISTIFFVLAKYIVLLFFPHPLTNDYYPAQIPVMLLSDWQVWLSILIYIGLIFLIVRDIRKNKIVSFGILFYLITLSIVSNIVFPVGTFMSERFLFMPSLGFAIVLGYLFYKLYEKINLSILFILIPVFALFSFKTITRNSVWKNDFTLYTTDVKTSSNSAKALNAAGGSLIDAASEEKDDNAKKKMLNEAIGYLDKALKIHPQYINALLLKSNAEYFLKNYENAIEGYEKILAKVPNYSDAQRNLSIALRDAGKYYGEQKNDLKKAIFYLQKSYNINSDDYETVRLFGIANAFSGNNDKALELFLKAVQLQPDNAGAYVNLGNLYYNIGDRVNGKKYHDKALSLNPDIFKSK
ncbi:MAG: tetratricopeptide repeat protein [Saprospiraceae bacterium]